jgi:hypothetical protein
MKVVVIAATSIAPSVLETSSVQLSAILKAVVLLLKGHLLGRRRWRRRK